jgi:hypothetical protein
MDTKTQAPLVSAFPFARYLMTGVNPPQYHGLQETFDYEGCLDAPTFVPAGSHESNAYFGTVEPTHAERSPRSDTRLSRIAC